MESVSTLKDHFCSNFLLVSVLERAWLWFQNPLASALKIGHSFLYDARLYHHTTTGILAVS